MSPISTRTMPGAAAKRRASTGRERGLNCIVARPKTRSIRKRLEPFRSRAWPGIAPRQRVAPPGVVGVWYLTGGNVRQFAIPAWWGGRQGLRPPGPYPRGRGRSARRGRARAGRGARDGGDRDEALGEVRNALIEADVALPVVKTFIDKVRPRAIGEDVIRSVTPAQQVVKIVHDVLVETLGEENAALNLGSPPAPILMVGLQGSGKTTTSAKIGLMLQTREKKRVLMASLDVSRPAAMEQLRVLGEQAAVATLPIVLGQGPLDIARRALASAKIGR